MSSNKLISIGFISIAIFSAAFEVHAAAVPAKTRILIVPGHEPASGGAEFGKTKERDLAVELGQNLEKLLRADSTYKVYITRDTESWTPTFEDYFNAHTKSITDWQEKARQNAVILSPSLLIHNKADADVGLRLYGIIKWSNENAIDLMIHVHFNDDPVHARKKPGNFSGFSIYVPSDEYSNSSTSQAIASSLFKRLSKYNPVSNLKQESAGIIKNPDLIAVGANNTSKAPSIIIEYEYLYASQLTDSKLRSVFLKDLAYQTYLGLQDFFAKKNATAVNSYGSAILPYLWLGPVTSTSTSSDIYALQTTLMAIGDYPPKGKSKNDCPRSGVFGSCTRNALKAFQNREGILGESGVAGSKTIEALHEGI